jgi:hypothetical protein
MRRFMAVLLAYGMLTPVVTRSEDRERAGRETFDAQREPLAVYHWARGPHEAREPARTSGAGASPNLIYHGGTVLTTTVTGAIFWGSRWTDATFVGDKISGLDSFYLGVGGSNYAKTNGEYTGSNGKVTSAITYLGHVIDSSAAPPRAPKTSSVLGEVCKVVGNQAVANGFYSVFVDTPRGTANYCAWHSWGSCNGVPIQFAFYFNLDGDPGCDPGAAAGHSQGLSALANVAGHELSEAMTDPRGYGWYDNQGAENADKCAWTFSPSLVPLSNGTTWKIQGNWSNAAYNANAGYAKGGCIDGNGFLAAGVQ